MVIIYGSSGARSDRVVWALEEAECDYEFRKLNFRTGEHRQEPFLSINPGGKVPALLDGDLTITESTAIVSYVGRKYSKFQLVPEGDLAKQAAYDQWTSFLITELEQPLWSIGKHKFALPAEWRIAEMLNTAAKEFAVAAALLAGHLDGRDFMLGDQFTMVDVIAADTLHWARRCAQPLNSDVLESYADRMFTRPARKRAADKGTVSTKG